LSGLNLYKLKQEKSLQVTYQLHHFAVHHCETSDLTQKNMNSVHARPVFDHAEHNLASKRLKSGHQTEKFPISKEWVPQLFVVDDYGNSKPEGPTLHKEQGVKVKTDKNRGKHVGHEEPKVREASVVLHKAHMAVTPAQRTGCDGKNNGSCHIGEHFEHCPKGISGSAHDASTDRIMSHALVATRGQMVTRNQGKHVECYKK
jgi:hypothetical protein